MWHNVTMHHIFIAVALRGLPTRAAFALPSSTAAFRSVSGGPHVALPYGVYLTDPTAAAGLAAAYNASADSCRLQPFPFNSTSSLPQAAMAAAAANAAAFQPVSALGRYVTTSPTTAFASSAWVIILLAFKPQCKSCFCKRLCSLFEILPEGLHLKASNEVFWNRLFHGSNFTCACGLPFVVKSLSTERCALLFQN